MSGRVAIATFVLSLLGATYQLMSYGLAFLVDSRANYNYYFGFNGIFTVIATVVVFWAVSHLLDGPDSQRVVWPAIILAIGVANLGNLIIAWATPAIVEPLALQTVPLDTIVTLVPAPLLMILGGVCGLVALQQQRKTSRIGTALNKLDGQIMD
jgi:hypothetical protein